METKAELLEIAQAELPEYLKKIKERDSDLKIPEFKIYPEVKDVTIIAHDSEDEDEDIFSVLVTVLQKKKKKDQYVDRTYFGAICYHHSERYLEHAFVNTSEKMKLFLKYFVEYLVYNVMSEKEIPLNQWNQWDGIKDIKE